MKRITGLVLVKETGVGVPNLVVAVFDSDVTNEELQKQESVAGVVQRAGRRVSSVLTDSDGKFNLCTEDLEFTGNEPRPDLLLMVLAPEDVQDIRRPFPLSTEQRTLYVSTVPRIDAGAEEAYVVRLLQAQIERFKIPIGSTGRDTDTVIRQLSSSALNAFQVREGVRAQLTEKLQAQQKIINNGRRLAKAKLNNLSALPLHARSPEAQKNALIIRGKAQVPAELPALQAKSISDGLAKLKDAAVKPTMTLRLTVAEIKALGLNVKDGVVSGKISGAKLSEKVKSLVNVLDLVRVRNVVTPSIEELAKRYLSPNSSSPVRPTNTPASKSKKSPVRRRKNA